MAMMQWIIVRFAKQDIVAAPCLFDEISGVDEFFVLNGPDFID
jgi:hypothetical protein